MKIVLSDIARAEDPGPFDWQAYFERTHAHAEPMRVLGKPCHDCAITCDFYTPYAEELSKLPRPFQLQIAERWFCHNHTNRACRGAKDYLDAALARSLSEEKAP